MPLVVVADVNTASPNLYFVHADHLNRPIKMTDAAQAVVWDAIYRPFGEAYSITGSATNNLRFPGQYFLLESGLAYNWYRHYDPSIGRYLQPDPAEFNDGPSLYAYAGSSPAMNTDARGQQAVPLPGILPPPMVVPGTKEFKSWQRYANRQMQKLQELLESFQRLCLSPLGSSDDYDRCIAAANGTEEDWGIFCGSLPADLRNRVIGGQSARRACWEKTFESRINKENWCENQFGSQ